LTHVGGPTVTCGEPAETEKLAFALRVLPATDSEDDPARRHVHGFHSYPARLHPTTAARLIDSFVPSGGLVLDPFCGSGTVLVEGLVRKRSVIGTDLNPIAILLTRCKTRVRTEAELTSLVREARRCAAVADDRRKSRSGASRRFPPADLRLFEPHVLLELDSLRESIEHASDPTTRTDLTLVLSAILVKLSRRQGDTSPRLVMRRTSAGFATRLFVQKAEDLASRLRAFAKLVAGSSPAPCCRVEADDATRLVSLASESVDAIVTSPPYVATYDYHAHHELRLRWLGLEGETFRRSELGSRAKYCRLSPAAAKSQWTQELGAFFGSARRVLRRNGPLVLLIGDSSVGRTALRADEVVRDVAPAAGFHLVARASQVRPHHYGPGQAAFHDRPRYEHAILLRKIG
jgi:hypothetical protein